jgi:hypothetical protein
MQLIKSGENLYAIRNEANEEYFQDTITTMSSQISSDAQLWIIEPYEGLANAYTIQNAKNLKYMTNKASQLHKGTPGSGEIWIIQNRQVVIREDLADSYYASLQNDQNSEYRTNRATELSATMTIPTRLFKMVLLENGRYGIQNQGNYEFLQSHISTMATGIVDDGQEWNVEPVSGKAGLHTLQSEKNKEYMTRKASQLHGGTPGKDEYWRIAQYPYLETASWMRDNWSLVADRPLNRICVPGSHDSGTYTYTALTLFGAVSTTKTQIFDIQMQLMQGIRVFDLRPALHDGRFFTYHATNVLDAGALQGAIGPSMEAIFAQVRAFAGKPEHKQELIVLNFTHALRWSGAGHERALSADQKRQFVEQVKAQLGDLLIRRKATQLTELTCSNLLTSRATVICLFADDEFGTTEGETEEGIWNSKYFRMKGSYSDTDNLNQMINGTNGTEARSQHSKLQSSNRSLPANKESFMFELCWQLTLPWPSSSSILSLASEANPALGPTLTQWMNSQVINKSVYPNIINTDACQESDTKAVELCIAIMGCIHS